MESMASEDERKAPINVQENCIDAGCGSSSDGQYQKFTLYETRSNFYLFGLERRKKNWKVLKISRLEQSDLSLVEDSTLYSQEEQSELLRRIDDGNKSTGGLKFVTTCYGIVGFIKFLGPYYMILITKRKRIGTICGHAVYSIAKSEMIPLPHSSVQSNMAYSKNENRSFANSTCKKPQCYNERTNLQDRICLLYLCTLIVCHYFSCSLIYPTFIKALWVYLSFMFCDNEENAIVIYSFLEMLSKVLSVSTLVKLFLVPVASVSQWMCRGKPH